MYDCNFYLETGIKKNAWQEGASMYEARQVPTTLLNRLYVWQETLASKPIWSLMRVCFTFARCDFNGRLRTADEVHSMSLANLQEEYCAVVDTAAVLAAGEVRF